VQVTSDPFRVFAASRLTDRHRQDASDEEEPERPSDETPSRRILAFEHDVLDEQEDGGAESRSHCRSDNETSPDGGHTYTAERFVLGVP
jgi:hypothetical protein